MVGVREGKWCEVGCGRDGECEMGEMGEMGEICG